jgi:hypothetical protein
MERNRSTRVVVRRHVVVVYISHKRYQFRGPGLMSSHIFSRKNSAKLSGAGKTPEMVFPFLASIYSKYYIHTEKDFTIFMES